MDPRLSLYMANEHAVKHEWSEMYDLLGYYWEWREKGGCEPPSGDLVACLIETLYDQEDLGFVARVHHVIRGYFRDNK